MQFFEKVILRCLNCKTLNSVPAKRLKESPNCGKCKKPLQYPFSPVEATELNFKKEMSEWEGALLVDFGASWCGACRMIDPVLKELASERAGSLKIIKVDVDKESGIARNFFITATPTLVLFYKGKKLDQVTGALQKEQLIEWIDSTIMKQV